MENAHEYFNSYTCKVRKTHTHNTRFSSGGALTLAKLNGESGKRMFKYDGIKLWNRLPTQVRNRENYIQLK